MVLLQRVAMYWKIRVLKFAGRGFAAAMLMIAAGNAMAQMPALIQGIEVPEATVPERQSVGERPRPDYDPLGMRAASFLIFPAADFDATYNSNVFATRAGTKSDLYGSLRPSINVLSDWNSNALVFHADGELRRYANLVSENQSNGEAAVSGRLDQAYNVFFTGGAGYKRAHEDRSSPDSTFNQKNPTEYQVASGRLGYVHESGTVGFRLDGGNDSYWYSNGHTNTGATVPETDRNRNELGLTPRVSYEFIPGYHAFIKAPLNDRIYDSSRDQNGFKRNSHGYEIDAGTAVGLGEIVNGEVFAGYFQQTYDDNRLKSPSGVTFGGNVLWNITELTSIKGAVSRSVQELTPNLAPASSYVSTDASVTIEHELLRNIILALTGVYSNDAYQGITRTDNLYQGTFGIRYLMNRNLWLALEATYRDRESNVPGAAFNQAIIAANVRLQY